MEPPDNVLSCLQTLLEGVSKAVIKQKPEDIAGFLACYFQEFIDFQKENPNLLLAEVVEKFDLKQEASNGELEEKTSNNNEALPSTVKSFAFLLRKESCTDGGEDHLLDPTEVNSSGTAPCSSPGSSIPESKHSTGPDGGSPSDLEHAPFDVEDSGSVCMVRDVATTAQTIEEDVSAVSEASGSQLGVQPWSSVSGELGPSANQVLVLTTDINQLSSVLLQEGISSLPLPPPPFKEELQAAPSCSAAEAISTTDKLIMNAEVPSYMQQFPGQVIISFDGQALSSVKLSLNADQLSGLDANDAMFQPEQMGTIAPMESAGQPFCFRVECCILDETLNN